MVLYTHEVVQIVPVKGCNTLGNIALRVQSLLVARLKVVVAVRAGTECIPCSRDDVAH